MAGGSAMLHHIRAHLGAPPPPGWQQQWRQSGPAAAVSPVVGGSLSTNLTGNVAVVTGAAGAIGREVAAQLMRNGCSVCICDKGGRSRAMGGEWRDGLAVLEQTAEELRTAVAGAGDCIVAVCDVTDQAQVDAMVELVDSTYGRLDILANVAGIGQPPGGRLPFREARIQDWDLVLDVDLTGIFRVTQAAVPLLDKAVEQGGSARVINIASVAGVLPLQLQAAYSAAKSGVISLTQSMALELGKQGILCNAIAPGTIATEGTARLWGEVTVDEAGNATHDTQTERGASGNQALLVRAADSEGGKADDSTPRSPTFVSRADAQLHMSMIALGRPGTPNDIAQGVLFLCASNYTNGHCLVIDGAWSICIRPF